MKGFKRASRVLPSLLLLLLQLATCATAQDVYTALTTCVLTMTGTGASAGAVTALTMKCTGPPTIFYIGVDASLDPYRMNITGVGPGFGPDKNTDYLNLTYGEGPPGCRRTNCLITLCGTTPVAFVESSITGVNAPDKDGILCFFQDVVASWQGSTSFNTAKNATIVVKGSSQVTVLKGSSFHDNVGTITAGAWNVRESAVVTFDTTTFSNNWAKGGSGAALLITDGATVTMKDSRMSLNRALTSGGAVFVGGRSTVELRNTVLFNNSALEGGAVMLQGPASAVLTNVTVWRNNATSNGGGVRLTGAASLALASGIVLNNVALGDGGGISAMGDGAIIRLSDSSLAGNVAAKFGGAIAAQGNITLAITNMEMTANTAPVGGGLAAYLSGSPELLTLTGNNIFSKNTGSLQGVHGGSAPDETTCGFIQDDCAMEAQICKGFDAGFCYQTGTPEPATSVHGVNNVCVGTHDPLIAIIVFSIFGAGVFLSLVLVSFQLRARFTRPGALEELVARGVAGWRKGLSSRWGPLLSALAQAVLMVANIVSDVLLLMAIFPDLLWVVYLAFIVAPRILATLVLHMRLVEYTWDNDSSRYPTLYAYKLHAQLSERVSRMAIWPLGLLVLWPFLLIGDIPMMLANLASAHFFSWLNLYNYLWLHSFTMLLESILSAGAATWLYYASRFFVSDWLYAFALATSMAHIACWVCPLVVLMARGAFIHVLKPYFTDLVTPEVEPPETPVPDPGMKDMQISVDGAGGGHPGAMYDVGALVDDFKHARKGERAPRDASPSRA